MLFLQAKRILKKTQLEKHSFEFVFSLDTDLFILRLKHIFYP